MVCDLYGHKGRLQRLLKKAIKPGSKILELNCG